MEYQHEKIACNIPEAVEISGIHARQHSQMTPAIKKGSRLREALLILCRRIVRTQRNLTNEQYSKHQDGDTDPFRRYN